ncbi:MAG TPA: Ig-like domain repeat protein, partial [bacterium]|nr:Ig-like domain repeat protein [bacterium]
VAAVKINNTEVSVRISAVKGNRVIIANSLSILEKYLNDKNSVSEGFADRLLSDLKEFEEGYYDLEKWDLDSGLDIAEDTGGERIVYGKLLNDDGYMSETVQVSVLVDKSAPGVINPAVTPNPAKLGDIVTAVFSFTEPLDLEKLDLDWDGLAFAESESVTENVFSYTFEVTDETEERTFSLKGRAYDEIGNGPVHFNIGELKVDRTLPGISDETVSVTDDKSAIKEDDEVTVTFKVSEELEKVPEVTVDGKKFNRVGDLTEPYTYKYSVTEADIEGVKTVLVSLSDLARNQNVVEMAQTVKFDLSAPAVINPTVTPAGEPGNAGIGTKIEVRFNISEPVTELKFLVNGEESELFKETVSGLTYSYTRNVEGSESATHYVFSVSAVDAAGNTLEPYTLGTVAIDVGMPSVLSHTLSKTNVKLLEVFTLDLQLSEELKSITVLAGSKDISSGCVKSTTDFKNYTCTHTANVDSDEGDGVKQFSVQMTDMSGNSSTVQLKKTGGSPLTIEYDVTPPAVVNPVIAPSKANLDSTIDVRFSFTEDVENVVIDWNGLDFTRFNDENDKKLFIYKHKVAESDEEKSYLIRIMEAADMAGNPISSQIEIGTVEIDNTAPQIENSVIMVSGDDSRRYVLENEPVSISFEVQEEISDSAVRIGLKKLETCTNEDISGGKKYTCTYSTPSSVDGEGTKDVTVEVKDLAGNGTSYPIGQLTYDMSAPQLSSTIVIPERVNSSHGEVKVQFSFSEDVQIEVDEVYIIPENFGPALPLNCNTGSDYGKQFECRSFFLPEDERVENYDVSVKVRDKAGNEVSEIFVGEIEIDREKPYLSAQNVNPSAVKENELFTISFTVNEALVSKPVVKVGDKQLSEISCTNTGGYNYVCEHNANKDSDETDGVKSVTVNLRDPAGNTSIITLSKTVTYDATRPELLNPVIIPEGTANRYNSTVQVRFSFSEKINYPSSFDFTVVSSKGGSVPAFNCTPANANHQSFTCETVFDPSDETDDTFTFRVNASDLAGNTLKTDGTPVDAGTLKVDRAEPDVTFNNVSPLNVLKSTGSVTVQFTVSEELSGLP